MQSNDLKRFYQRSLRHRDALDTNQEMPLGCFYCLHQFTLKQYSSEKLQWLDEGQTLRCPNCDIDSVVYGEDAVNALKDLRNYYFREPSKDELVVLTTYRTDAHRLVIIGIQRDQHNQVHRVTICK